MKEKYNFPNILFFYLEKSVILGNGECRNKVRRLLVNKGKTDGRVQKKRQNGSKQKNEEKRRDSFRHHFDCGGRCVLFFRAPTVSDFYGYHKGEQEYKKLKDIGLSTEDDSADGGGRYLVDFEEL